jgi:hypothetical protein
MRKNLLAGTAILVALAAYFWYDNRGLHSWYRSIVAQAQAEGLVPLLGAEHKTSDLINPISWFDPAPDSQWFIPQVFVANDHTRGGDPCAVRVINYSKYKPYRDEFVVVYSSDRKSHEFIDLEQVKARLTDGKFDFMPNGPNSFHVQLLELTKP